MIKLLNNLKIEWNFLHLETLFLILRSGKVRMLISFLQYNIEVKVLASAGRKLNKDWKERKEVFIILSMTVYVITNGIIKSTRNNYI